MELFKVAQSLSMHYRGKCVFVAIDLSDKSESTQAILKDIGINSQSSSFWIISSKQTSVNFYKLENIDAEKSNEAFATQITLQLDDFFKGSLSPSKVASTGES